MRRSLRCYTEEVRRMSNAIKNVMLRVIGKRVAEGEKFEDIIKDYPRLTSKEIEEIREAL